MVGGVDLALQDAAFGGGLCGGKLLVQAEHALDQGDHAVVALDVGGVGEVDGADGKLFDKLRKKYLKKPFCIGVLDLF